MLYIGVLIIGLVIGFFIGYVYTEGLNICDYCHRKGLTKFYRIIKINEKAHFEKICRKCAKDNKWQTILDFDRHMETLNRQVNIQPVEIYIEEEDK